MAVTVKSYKTMLQSALGNPAPWHIIIFQGDRPDYTADGYGNNTSHTGEEILDYLESKGIPKDRVYVDTDGLSIANFPRYDIASQSFNQVTRTYSPALDYEPKTGDILEVLPETQLLSNTTIATDLVVLPVNDGNSYLNTQMYRNGGALGQQAYVRTIGSGSIYRYVNTKIVWLDDYSNFDPTLFNFPEARIYQIDPSNRASVENQRYHLTVNTVTAASFASGSAPHPVMSWIYGHILAGDLESYEWEPGDDEDPYGKDGYSEQQGGQGTASWEGDLIGIPALPSLSAVDTGFISLYNPSASQVQALASYMWDTAFDLESFKKIVANPIDCILGLAIFPVDPQSGSSKPIKVGNIVTSVSMPPVISQWQEKDCGTLDVQEYWGSYLDYSPYTKISLYLPFIGVIPLDVDDVMGGPIHVVYHIDMLSGACVAYVLCHGTQLYTYIGQCSCNIPITSNDYTNTVNGVLGIAGNIGSLVSSGGKGGGAISAIAGIASNAINMFKPNVQKSGALSGTGGLMGVQVPYLIMQRPKQSLARTHAATKGYPANISVQLGSISGYAEIDAIDLEGVPCTQAEAEEIEQLLKSGVYL